MDKTKLGILLGIIAGVIDVIPMIIQKLALDAKISAFVFWIIAGFFIAATKTDLKGALKGIAISILLLIPLAIIIGWGEPINLIPVILMNLILGSGLGFLIDKYGK